MQGFQRYLLLIYRLSFALPFCFLCFYAWLPVVMKRVDLWLWNLCASLLYFVVRERCRRKKVHVRYLIS